ncbi:MAG: hypothetical protein Q8910_04280 [Bacteroidota bacterium]|nr:hypothetical protein [Bacteroidota bacterium]
MPDIIGGINMSNQVLCVMSKIKEGTVITFQTVDSVMAGDMFGLDYDDKQHYFEVIEVTTKDPIAWSVSRLSVQAREVGYYHLFSKQKDFDLRVIPSLRVYSIKDKDTLAKISKERCYC